MGVKRDKDREASVSVSIKSRQKAGCRLGAQEMADVFTNKVTVGK